MKKDTSWGKVADWYADHVEKEDSYHKSVILPNLLRLMNVKSSTNNIEVLDLACGSGFFTEEFRKAGATARGLDISAELIALAKKQYPGGAKFAVAPANAFPEIENNSVDIVTIILAIQNIREVKEVFMECERVLKSNGRLFIVMNHPAFRIPGSSSWGWDFEKKQQYRRIDQYLSEKTIPIVMHPGSKNSDKTISFHRSLQYYMKLSDNTGFAAKRIEEWISNKESEVGPRKTEEDRIRKEIPLFMCIELLKCVA